VVCGEASFKDARRTSLLNPTVLVEVLSRSTERYDRTTKARFYDQIPSLRAYVLVAQDYRGVDVLTRAEAGWTLSSEDDDQVRIPPLNVMLSLDDVYEGVTFPDTDEPPRVAPQV
jgi:Uma2 family endonuclease